MRDRTRNPLHQDVDVYQVISKSESRASLPRYLISQSDYMALLQYPFR